MPPHCSKGWSCIEDRVAVNQFIGDQLGKVGVGK
jgi:hypothetical protein